MGAGLGAGLGQGPAAQPPGPPEQHSPVQVEPSPPEQVAALEFIVQKVLAPPTTAARANGNTAFSNILLNERITAFPFLVVPDDPAFVKPDEPA